MFQIYKNFESLDVATLRSAFRVARLKADRTFSLLSANSAKGTFSEEPSANGSGYHATKGENIPLEARIISVADVYDALTSDRPYRKAMSPFAAKEVIVKGSGTDFDPKVVQAFQAVLGAGKMEVPELVL